MKTLKFECKLPNNHPGVLKFLKISPSVLEWTSQVAGQPIHRFLIELFNECDGKGKHRQVVIHIDHRIMRMDASRRSAQHDGWDALIGQME